MMSNVLNPFPTITTITACYLICFCTLVAFCTEMNPDQTATLGAVGSGFIVFAIMEKNICTGLKLRVRSKNNFLISQPKHMLWVLKRTISYSSLEHPKHMLNRWVRKNYTQKFCLSKPMLIAIIKG